ncbi:FecR domain-containing protein [Pseudodesulfovibrio sp. zrk46]|uniref:FecR domain-containing protein n=1 Tax=Pseudodesulfovibrio sp. zrk46 TaxID=2725288 RepID=UPI00144A059A|nr:FecR domain-containing protein [Pseudodesulfovibrio sp. zrk46]QJB55489.1 hypothetical protein HFN16_03365 [Pseudodesulfovibrio sp. zrk46]
MEPIGHITVCHGAATATGEDGTRELTEGSPLYENDAILTAKGGSVEIKFIDNALLALGEESEVVLDKYVYSDDMGDAVIKMVEGTFRTTTGALVDVNPEGFLLETPLSTVGIRGTDIGVNVPGGGEPDQVFLLEFDGKPVVVGSTIPGRAPVILTTSGSLTTITPSGPGPIEPMTPQQFQFFDQFTPDSLRQSPPAQQELSEDDTGDDGGVDGDEAGSEMPGELADAGEQGGSGEGGEQLTLFGADGGDEPHADGPHQLFHAQFGLMPNGGLLPATPGNFALPQPIQPIEETQYDDAGTGSDSDTTLISIQDMPSFGRDSDGTDVDQTGFTVDEKTDGADTFDGSLADSTMVIAHDGDDDISGTIGDDCMLFGGGGDDELSCYGDTCVLSGGTGNDTLIGTNGDSLVGGSGSDLFGVGGASAGTFNFTVLDFSSAEGDKIGFTNVVTEFVHDDNSDGVLDSNYFASFENYGDYDPSYGALSGGNSDHKFVYAPIDAGETQWGLYYCSDGTGAGTNGELFVTFDSDVDLTADDITFPTIT